MKTAQKDADGVAAMIQTISYTLASFEMKFKIAHGLAKTQVARNNGVTPSIMEDSLAIAALCLAICAERI